MVRSVTLFIFSTASIRTFRVVETVDSEDDLDLVSVLDEDGCVLRELNEALKGDADGQSLDMNGAAGQLRQHVVPVHSTPEPSAAAVDEVGAVVLYVEPHEITG